MAQRSQHRPAGSQPVRGGQRAAAGVSQPDTVVALVGPTGAGKSALAVHAAEALGAEIVAVDAFTVYRGMDIGTAKPSAETRARVPHHLVDVLDPGRDCDVRWFQAAARRAIAAVHARGRPALLVGGSGLYFRAAVDPLVFPPTDPAVRAELETRFAGDPHGAHAALARVDPDAAARIDPANLRRSVRALEVVELTGWRFSQYRNAWDRHDSVYGSLHVVGLAVSRAMLAERIAARAETMLAAGLVAEARRLALRPLAATARQAIGYAEALEHVAGRADRAETRRRIAARTRRYAVRQQRWFRADPRVAWAPADEVVAALTARAAPEEGSTGT